MTTAGAPLVSVIIPAFNCGRFAAEAVESALAQDYKPMQVIVINDGSTDDTLAVLETFGAAIHLIDQKNGGPPAARNSGLRVARGAYIAFLDADDVWLPGKISAQVAYLEGHPKIGIVYTDWHVWQPEIDGSFRRPLIGNPISGDLTLDATRSGCLYNRLLLDCELLTTTVMLRASLAREIGEFDPTLLIGEDYDYWIRASRITEIHKLAAVGALYRIQPNAAAGKLRRPNFEFDVISKAIGRWGLVGPDGSVTDSDAIKDRLEKLDFQHGYAHFHRGDPRLALATFRRLLRRHPANPKLWMYLALSVARMGALL